MSKTALAAAVPAMVVFVLGAPACSTRSGPPAQVAAAPGRELPPDPIPSPPVTTSAPEALGLLRDYAELLQTIAAQGSLENGIARSELDRLVDRAHALHREERLDDDFDRRYRRLVDITILILHPSSGAAKDDAAHQLAAFVDDVDETPRTVDPDGGLHEFAPTLIEEFTNLHVAVEPTADRETVRGQFFGPQQ